MVPLEDQYNEYIPGFFIGVEMNIFSLYRQSYTILDSHQIILILT